ncbi:MAG: hypothetical protein MEQ07_03090 [Aquimonas sp.]|nr:hypothetical protein [Aquimonas sp.]
MRAHRNTATRFFSAGVPVLLVLLLAAPCACAETWLGRFGSAGEPDVIRVFTDSASGDVAPVAQLGGSNTQLASASGLFFDTLAKEVYVADFAGRQIVVLGATARGDAVPMRRLSSTQGIGQPRKAVRIGASEEIAVLRGSLGIHVFPREGSGELAPVRSIQGSATLLQAGNPNSIAHLPLTGEFVVADGKLNAQGYAGDLLFYPDSASGNVAPSRRRSGPALGRFVWDVLWLPSRPDELFLLVEGQAVGGLSEMRVVVIPVAGDGPVTALREIGGSQTQMFNGGAMAYIPDAGEIVVASGLYGVTPRVVSFPASGTGNLSPRRNLAGAQVGGPFQGIAHVDGDRLFAHGFEG